MTRILLINPNTCPATTGMMLAIARSVAPPGVVVTGATASRGPGMIVDAEELRAAAVEVVAVGRRHARDISGIIVAAFGDPGVDRLRREVAVPVVGIAEAGMLEAAGTGRRFGVATVTPALAGVNADRAAALGLGHLYTGTRLTAGDPRRLTAEPGRLIEALAEAVTRCIRDDKAQAVVIGGGPLGDAAAALASRFDVPVIAPIPAAVRRLLAAIGNRSATTGVPGGEFHRDKADEDSSSGLATSSPGPLGIEEHMINKSPSRG